MLGYQDVQKLIILFVIIAACYTLTCIFINHKISDEQLSKVIMTLIDDQEALRRGVNGRIKSYSNTKACIQRSLPVNSSEIMKFVKDIAPINCSSAGIDWVVCKDSICRIREEIKILNEHVKCSFTDIIRINDYIQFEGDITYSKNFYQLKGSDVVKVNCKCLNKEWTSVLTGIRYDKSIFKRTGWEHVPWNSFKLNILMLGFDSISRNTFIRKLPKSYKYLTETLRGVVLKGYNILGDGTPQALTPLLTGKTELELPDVRKRMPHSYNVDVYPFLWKDFRNAGYVTSFLEDLPETGVYQLRLNGFNQPPTDHYMRPYYLAINQKIKEWPKLCSGEIPRHKVMLEYIQNFFSVYKTKPKFLFGFHGELSHGDYNLIGAADEDLVQFLKNFENNDNFKNTLLILMADHGPRFTAIRNTTQGKLEERLPFFSFRFPSAFKLKYWKAYNNFLSNLEALTTPFDIYATLNTILGKKDIPNLENRAISLFNKIPENRSCADAYIEPHWCTCLDWENVTVKHHDLLVNALSKTFENTVNDYLKPYNHMCAKLSILKVFWVLQLKLKDDLIKFKKSADTDGFNPEMSDSINIQQRMYQIKVLVLPGYSLFEATITENNNTFFINMTDISRINKYGLQARCVENSFPYLRKYCYCKTV